MRIKSLVVFFLFISGFCIAQTANISGIINAYTSVSVVNTQAVTVASAASFTTGDKVLLIQMKGATIDQTNTHAYGTILNYNNAGNYEIAVIASIAGNTINFVSPISRSYTASDIVQLVKVPVYTNVNITGLLTCTPWNGTTGGVLAFEASGTITFNANIDVSGMGFLGGILSNGAITSCSADTFDYVLPSTTLAAARKGEGIFNPTTTNIDGKGAWANGGGSGNDCNGGGAGGGNYGLGGHGGDPKVNVSCPAFFYQNSGGNSGKNLVYSNAANKIFLGGGGGSGHQNDGAGTAGTNGGGIVLISGQSIIGNNNFINSNGVDNVIVAGIDGQGGGGAGGTVLLNVCSYSSLNVSVKGGLGGHDNFTGQDCHGKGGGGAGGIVWSSSALTNVTTVLTGGQPGVFTASGCLCIGTSNGATAGGIGGTITGLVLPGYTPPVQIKDTSICSTYSPVVLDAGVGGASYAWSNGNNTQTTSVNSSGTYWVQITPSNGCMLVTDTFHVQFVTAGSTIDIIKDTTFCSIGGVYNLNEAQANANSYNWSTGATTSSINVNTSGIYWVDVNINNCIIRDSADITLLNVPFLTAPNYTVCNGQTININPSVSGGSGSYSYNWGNGFTGASYQTTPKADSTYLISITDQTTGCTTSIQTGSISVLPPLQVTVNGVSTCVSADTVKLLATATGGTGNYSYTWLPTNTNQNPLLILPTTSIVYTVVVSDGCGVPASDTAQLIITPAPIIMLPNHISGCSPVCVNLNSTPYDTLKSWQWNFGDGNTSNTQTPFHCYSTQGVYNISFSYTTALGCVKTVSSNSLVTVFSAPVAAFSASAFDTDVFDTDISFYNQSTNYTITQWYFGDSTGSNLIGPTHLYSSETPGTYQVTLIVHNQRGCTDTVIHEVVINDVFTFYAPNAFSPNADNHNEKFLPLGTGWDNASFRMLIFDRWGNQVLNTNNPYQGWDGKMKGQDAQQDIYVWKVELKDIFNKSHSYSGTITLIR